MTTTVQAGIAGGHQATVEAAAAILRAGGNAFDATVAGLFAACASEPVLASPGGGGFVMAVSAGSAQPIVYDFFTQTPRARRDDGAGDLRHVTANFGTATQDFHIGAGATAIPGFVPGLARMHGELGVLAWADVLAPAIALARGGLTMTDFQAYLFSVVAPILLDTPCARKLFAPEGRLLATGERFANPVLAGTLEQLACEGPDLFTHGPIADEIVAQSEICGGHLTRADLAGYQVERRAPLKVTIGATQIYLNPPPAAGGALVGLALAALDDGLDEDRDGPLSPRQFLDAQKQANTVRDHCGGAPERLASALRKATAHPPAYRGTTHLSVIDRDGNAAAATVSNGEGCGMMLGRAGAQTGIMLNNMLGEDDLSPAGIGQWQANVRLSSMMTPTLAIAADGGITALGSGGSSRIRSAIFQVLARLVRDGSTLTQAVEAPRLHLEMDGRLSFEDVDGEVDSENLRRLSDNGHPWSERNMFFGGVHAVQRDADGRITGAGDPRRGGASTVVD